MPSKNTPQTAADVFTVDRNKTAEDVATQATPWVIVDGEGFAVVYRKPNGQRAPLTYKTSDSATKAALAMLARVQEVDPTALLVNVDDQGDAAPDDVTALRLIADGNALRAEVENDLEARGLITTSDAPYAELTDAGLAVIGKPAKSSAAVKRVPRATAAKPKPASKKATPKKTTAKKGMSALDAVAQVITENGGPMKLREAAALVVERKLAPGLKGKTPTATISAAVMVDCKKPDARFVKVERGVVDVKTAKS